MPVLRYFLFVGGALLALLFIANAWFPAAPASDKGRVENSQASTDLSVIRINSDRKLPEKVVFDTSRPTIAPPALVVAEAKAPKPPAPVVASAVTEATPKARVREAFAQLPIASNSPTEPRKPRKRKSVAKNYPRYYQNYPMRVAQQPRFGFFGNIW